MGQPAWLRQGQVLTPFYGSVTGSVNKGKDVIYLDFSNTFDSVSHHIPLCRLEWYEFGRWTV